MRFIFAILALSIASVTAMPNGTEDGETGGDAVAPQLDQPATRSSGNPGHQAHAQARLDENRPIISSGKFDHPTAVADVVDGVGNADGKSTYLSPDELATGTRKPKERINDLHVVRPSDVRAAGLETVADAGTVAPDGSQAPAGHVSITTPQGQPITPEAAAAAMGQVQRVAVKVNSHGQAEELLAEAEKDPNKPLQQVSADLKAKKAEEARQKKLAERAARQAQAKQAADSAKKDGGDPPAGGTTPATPACKRDGSFCSIGNRPKSAALKSAAGLKPTRSTKSKAAASGLKAIKGNRKVGKKTGINAVRKSAGKTGKGLKGQTTAKNIKGTKASKASKGIKGTKSTKTVTGHKSTKSSKALKGIKAPKRATSLKATKGAKLTKGSKALKSTKPVKGAKALKGVKSLKSKVTKGTKSLKSPKPTKGTKVKGAKVTKGAKPLKTKIPKKAKGAKSLKTKTAQGTKTLKTKVVKGSIKTTTKGAKSLKSPKVGKSTKGVKGAKAKGVQGTKANKATKGKAFKQTKTSTKFNASRKQATVASPRRASTIQVAAPKIKGALSALKKLSSLKKSGKKYVRRDMTVNRPRMVYEALEEYKRSMDALE